MIFLEQITNQILREEGQLIFSLSDFDLTWEDVEQLFIGTYEQAKGYISVYDWTKNVIGLNPQQVDYSHIRHITYNAYYQRLMPDVPPNQWEFNPYTNNVSSFVNTNFSLEVGKFPTIDNLPYEITLTDLKAGKEKRIVLPFIPTDTVNCDTLAINTQYVTLGKEEEFKNSYLDNTRCCPCNTEENQVLQFTGDISGDISLSKLSGSLRFNTDIDNVKLQFVSKYVGIKELDMTCELFYKWFKGNLLTMLGSIKTQTNVGSDLLPLNMDSDSLLERGREVLKEVDELKTTKSHWSNF